MSLRLNIKKTSIESAVSDRATHVVDENASRKTDRSNSVLSLENTDFTEIRRATALSKM